MGLSTYHDGVKPLDDMFEASADFSPDMEFEAFLKGVPAKWVVYLLADEEDRPVQLLCVKNLRHSLKRRLGGDESIGLSRRVNYREIVRRVYWRRVHSTLEQDWVYLEAARALFPKTYQGLLGFRPAWFVHVDPAAAFPRYTKTADLTQAAGVLIGPVEDKHSAQRLIELAEDSFDLCRYHNVLVEAPRGKACAYKEMGRCPAPCDGSVSMETYREAVGRSAAMLVDPTRFVEEQTRRMRELAAGLQFEGAQKAKGLIGQASQLGKGPFRHVGALKEFAFVSVQRGPREGTAKVFLVTPGKIEEVAGLVGEPVKGADLLRFVLARAAEGAGATVTAEGVERIGLVTHHLFAPKQAQGVFVRLSEIDEASLGKAWRELRKQKTLEETEGEGVVKELQAM